MLWLLLFVIAALALRLAVFLLNRKTPSHSKRQHPLLASQGSFVGSRPSQWHREEYSNEALVFVITDSNALTRRLAGVDPEGNVSVFVLPRDRFPVELGAILPPVTVGGCSLVMLHQSESGAVEFREAQIAIMKMAGEA